VRVVLLEVVAIVVTLAGVVGWLVYDRRARRHSSPVTIGRRAIRPVEIGIAATICLCCLLANGLAVAHVEPLSVDNLGPFATVYHERRPSLFLLGSLLFLLLLASFMPSLGRAALVLFVGAAAANILSPALWGGAVPDYLVLNRIDLVANLSDIVMIVTGTVAAASIVLLGRRGPQSQTR
jgi:hypothetical protein